MIKGRLLGLEHHVCDFLQSQHHPNPLNCLHNYFYDQKQYEYKYIYKGDSENGCYMSLICVGEMKRRSYQDEEALIGHLLVLRNGRKHRQHQAAEHQQETETHIFC